jgi:hypothetical protein
MASLRDFLRWLLYIVLATVCLAAGVFYFVHTRLDEEIRRHIEARFQTHYEGLQVGIRSARRVPGAGIEIRGLVIRDPRQPPQHNRMLYVDELLVRCDTDLGGLVQGQVCTQQIIARRLQLRARQLEDGSWDAAALLPLPKFGNQPPPAVLESATIELLPASATGRDPLALHDVNVTILPESSRSTHGAPHEAAADHPDWLRIMGTLSGSLFRTATIDGRLNVETAAWSIGAQVQGLGVSPDLVNLVPRRSSSPQVIPADFRGQADFRCHLEGQSNALADCRFTASGTFRGRIDDPRLPQPLTNALVVFRSNNEALQIDEATALAGETRVGMSGIFYRDGRLDLHASAESLFLGKRLFKSLPEKWREVWVRLQPEGLVNTDLQLAFDGQSWTHDFTLDGRGVSFAYDKFPYRLEDGRGRLRLTNGILQLHNVRALASDREVHFEGRLSNPGEDGLGWLQFSLAEPIPIDDRLISAIPEKTRRFIKKLDPHGMIHVQGRFERQPGNPPREHKQLTLNLSNCSMNYDDFPYPLHRIRGTLSMTGDQWVFRDLEAYNDSGWVTCHGTWTPQQQGGSLLSLDFNAMDIPLEDELREALRPGLQSIWNSLHPRGTIDHVKIALRYLSRTSELSTEVIAIKRPPEQNVEGRSITVKPSWLPYRWDNVEGHVRFQHGVAVLTNIRAEHGRTKAHFSGQMEISPQGQWRVHLEPLTVDHVDTSHELTSALPQELGRAVDKLNITGLVTLGGKLTLFGAEDPQVPPGAAWELDLDLENGGLNCGVPLQNIHGGLKVTGNTDGRHSQNRGELMVDSMTYKGIQFTNLKGPLHFEDAQLWIGEWIPQERTEGLPRPVVASVWGGSLALDGSVALQDQPRFELEASLADGDLAAISREASPSRPDITGRVFSNVLLSGNAQATHTLRGRGRLLLRDADLYRLPVMVRLLKPLMLKPPDQTAFDSSEVDFRIEGDRIYFDRIDFDGDAISLDGRGEMNFQRQINLTFGTAIGRDDLYNSLLRPMFKEAGRRLVLLHITGTLDQPHVRRELVPELNQTIQQLFPNQPREPRRTTSRLLNPRGMFQRVIPR